jgi:hypothetical protein
MLTEPQGITTDQQALYRKVDLTVFTLANLMNIIMVLIFLSRVAGTPRTSIIGVIWMGFIIVLTIIVVLNVKGRREWWTIALPSLMIAFLTLELILDYILQIDFRNTRLLGPYLLLYYTAILGMIGYTFQIGKRYGFITLLTYFMNQIATFYSYFQVGHG